MLKEIEIEANKQKFLELLQNVNRDGIDKVIQWISSSHSDFFTFPYTYFYVSYIFFHFPIHIFSFSRTLFSYLILKTIFAF